MNPQLTYERGRCDFCARGREGGGRRLVAVSTRPGVISPFRICRPCAHEAAAMLAIISEAASEAVAELRKGGR